MTTKRAQLISASGDMVTFEVDDKALRPVKMTGFNGMVEFADAVEAGREIWKNYRRAGFVQVVERNENYEMAVWDVLDGAGINPMSMMNRPYAHACNIILYGQIKGWAPSAVAGEIVKELELQLND